MDSWDIGLLVELGTVECSWKGDLQVIPSACKVKEQLSIIGAVPQDNTIGWKHLADLESGNLWNSVSYLLHNYGVVNNLLVVTYSVLGNLTSNYLPNISTLVYRHSNQLSITK